jgi:hypothetical protein
MGRRRIWLTKGLGVLALPSVIMLPPTRIFHSRAGQRIRARSLVVKGSRCGVETSAVFQRANFFLFFLEKKLLFTQTGSGLA